MNFREALSHAVTELRSANVPSPVLAVAQRNAVRHGLEGRITFVQSNLLAAFATHSFDLIVSNPPYIGRQESPSLPRELREHEPPQALFGGEEGIEVYAPHAHWN